METKKKEKDLQDAKDLALGLIAMTITFIALWASMWIVAWMK